MEVKVLGSGCSRCRSTVGMIERAAGASGVAVEIVKVERPEDTGKGGVGKTSLSTAAALTLADAGRQVLLVSTDAASNLDQMLGVELRNTPNPVPGAPGLWVLKITTGAVAAPGPRQSRREHNRKHLQPGCAPVDLHQGPPSRGVHAATD